MNFHVFTDNDDATWWIITGTDLYEMLDRVRRGEHPKDVYQETKNRRR